VPRLLTDWDSVLAAARELGAGERRALLGIAGAPGAGKSTLAERLVSDLGPAAAVVPMDGFHLPGTVLADRGLAEVKGAPETFDRAGYVALLQRLRDGAAGVVRAPRFDRAREASVADAIEVDPSVRLVVTEGNYLLFWPEVRALLDQAWFVEVCDDERRVETLIGRHMSFGRSAGDARRWVQRSDEANARLVSRGRGTADRVVRLW
jgi:pantothenate kinase